MTQRYLPMNAHEDAWSKDEFVAKVEAYINMTLREHLDDQGETNVTVDELYEAYLEAHEWISADLNFVRSLGGEQAYNTAIEQMMDPNNPKWDDSDEAESDEDETDENDDDEPEFEAVGFLVFGEADLL